MISERDEFHHAVGEHPRWSESYYFNVFDPASGVGGLTRLGVRPNEGTIDSGALLFLPGGRVAMVHVTAPQAENTDDLTVEGFRYERAEPMRRWRLGGKADALVMADPAVLVGADGPPPESMELELDLEFTALAPPHDIAGSPLADCFGGIGHYDQVGAYRGSIRIGGSAFDVDGLGMRDHTWGVRDWRAPERWRFFTAIFGADLIVVPSRIVIDGADLRGGFVCRDGVNHVITSLEMSSTFAEDGTPRTASLSIVDATGERIEMAGDLEYAAPLPMEGGAVLVHEARTRFTCDGRSGYGISEYLRQVALPAR